MKLDMEAVFIDFCIISMLLVLAKFIRLRFTFFQTHFIPVSLIAGIIGLIGGKQVLGILPFSNYISEYSGLLIMTLSASLFIGNKTGNSLKRMLQRVGDSFLLNSAAELGQFGISILIGYFLVHIFYPQMNDWFGILMPAGFVGDHGTAAVIGGILKKAGYTEAVSIGQTFATIGLLTGIFGGVLCINLAVKQHQTSFITDMKNIPGELRRGIIPESKRSSIGMQIMSPNAMDTLTWHLALVLTSIGAAYLINYFAGILIPEFTLPVYGICLLTGMLINWILKKINLISCVDKQIINRIGGTATDYLIAFGIASIDLKIVVDFWESIAVMSIVGVIYVVGYLLLVTRKCAGDHWFEKGIFIFGWSAGAMSVAIMLLRIVDPDYSSGILEEVSASWVFLTLVDMFIVTFVPLMLVRGFVLESSFFLVAAAVVLIWLSYQYYGKRRSNF